jgi:hypothetical protein
VGGEDITDRVRHRLVLPFIESFRSICYEIFP